MSRCHPFNSGCHQLVNINLKILKIMKEIKELETNGNGVYLQVINTENGKILAEFRGYCLDGSNKDEVEEYERFMHFFETL